MFAEDWADSVLYDAIADEEWSIFCSFLNCKNLDRRLEHRKTLLMYAAGHGHLQYVKSLIERGADVALVDEQGLSAKDLATENGHIAVAKLLELCEKGDLHQFLSIQRMVKRLASASYALEQPTNLVLEAAQFSELEKQKVEVPFPDVSALWFRVADKVHIGLNQDRQMMWEIEDKVFLHLW